LSNTRSRPIFSASRRPPPSAVATVAPPQAIAAPKPKEPERPQLALVGTIASGVERFGIFLNQSTAAALRLRIGEDFQGWKLSSVQGREATLEKDAQVVVLTLPQPGETPAEAVARLNPGLPPQPGQLLSAPQPRRRGQPNRQM
jgi:general secretion pathway protein N